MGVGVGGEDFGYVALVFAENMWMLSYLSKKMLHGLFFSNKFLQLLDFCRNVKFLKKSG